MLGPSVTQSPRGCMLQVFLPGGPFGLAWGVGEEGLGLMAWLRGGRPVGVFLP